MIRIGLVEPSVEELREEHGNLREVELRINGMVCGSCASHVKRDLERVNNVLKVRVDYKKNRGNVVYDGDWTSAETIAAGSTRYQANIINDRVI